MPLGPRSQILVEGLRGAAILLLLPALAVAAAYLLGTRLPRDHTATATGIVDAPDRVWDLLNDIPAQSTWRQVPMVIIRNHFDPATGDACWYEAWVLTKFLLCATNTGRTHRIIQTTGTFQPFAATWTFDPSPAPNNRTTVYITEQSSIDRPLWRFLGTYIIRRQTAAQYYLSTLQQEASHHYPTGP